MVRLTAAAKSAWFYARWYPTLWMPTLFSDTPGIHPAFRRDVRKIRASSKKLARSLFHAMAVEGPKLEKRQALLGRFVDIGAELFAQTASIARASDLLRSGK